MAFSKTLLQSAVLGVVIIAVVVPVISIPVRSGDDCGREFEKFKRVHAKQYFSQAEHDHRLGTFCSSLREIEQINSAGLSWRAGTNEYSDLTAEEFMDRFTMKDEQNCSATISQPVSSFVPLSTDLPEARDWRNQTCGETSCVSMIKNQGSCGSCWTFSTVAALEAIHAITTDMMMLFSEQQLVDCAQAFNNNGCNGGLPSQAFEYIRYAGGLYKMEEYPYVCGDGHCKPVSGKCKFHDKAKKIGVHVSNVANFSAGDEASMKAVVGAHHPVSVAFEVVADLRHYASGVYKSTACESTPDKVNHAVLAVGYGVEDGLDYWTIKNSWGFGWGDNGYFKIQRNVNMCGIAVCSSFPVIPTIGKQVV
mmetsp:Transcript_39315/g.92696  ORF Transcript_39315/g.92696 Transcript_39315/m.92696 type:complete len:364 (-) Transcript_39315:179-1270(-)